MTTLAARTTRRDRLERRGPLQGHTDQPLNDYGRKQARALADRLAGNDIAAIYTSDLSRARETAEILAERLALPVVADPDLRERNWGNWEGLTGTERDRIEHVGEANEAHRSACSGQCSGSPRRTRTTASSS